VLELHRRREVLHSTPQVFVEFRNAPMRPVSVNGLGLTAAEADALAATYESRFPLLPETPDVYPAWKALVSAAGVVGKQVHDARLAAVCHVHGVPQVLTFNVRHFARLTAYGPGLVVINADSI
jgi:predicted nucleic acid-binding protein